MGAAAVRGAQRHVMACVKHFALNSIEEARFRVDVRVDDGVLREVYLPHFRHRRRGRCRVVMSAYNRVKGQWCGHSACCCARSSRASGASRVRDDRLRLGLRDARAGAPGGLDVEMPFRARTRGSLPAWSPRGEVPVSVVDEAAERVVAAKLALRRRRGARRRTRDAVAGPAHRALAREVAARSMVLLRNADVGGAPLLPLDTGSLRSIAVVGPLADVASLGDHGSSRVRPPHAVTPLEGLRAALPAEAELRVARGLGESVAAARECDAVVAVVGLTSAAGEWIGPMSGGSAAACACRPRLDSLLRALRGWIPAWSPSSWTSRCPW